MPSWTTPYNHTTGQVVTAAHMDTYLSDNTTVLRANALSGMGELIATATPSAAASVAFSSLTTNYTHLGFVAYGLYADGVSAMQMRFNGDSGANYNFAFLGHDNADADASTGASAQTLISMATIINTGSTTNAVIRGYIQAYRNTGVLKRVLLYAVGNGKAMYGMGQWESAAAITTVTFIFGGNNGTGTISMYGMND